LSCRLGHGGRHWRRARLHLRRILSGFGGGFLLGELLKMLASEFGMIQVERARVRLFFGDADLGQIVDQDLGLNLQLARQLIDPNLIGV
jgi:hypothetical protein